ncbi:glycosyltransferase family 61 protein [Nostoc sp.]|uniref:glycosyltransferase family 61 protein n=1 Tax=Nostoc sp. TaxID=1180 RepID=UPI003FA5576A
MVQAKTLSNAEVIVAPHGAGLTNLIFCSQGTKVIEIFSPHYLNLTYWGLSNLMKLDYYYIISESSVAGFNLSIDECREDNLLIPLDKLLNTLKIADIVG